MIAVVRGVIAASAASRSISPVPGSLSTSTGGAPACSTAFAEATNVIAGTSTSSPGPDPEDLIASISAAVHDETQRTCGTPTYSSSIRSKRCTFGPVPIQPERSESTTSAISASPITGLPKTRNSSRTLRRSVRGRRNASKARRRASLGPSHWLAASDSRGRRRLLPRPSPPAGRGLVEGAERVCPGIHVGERQGLSARWGSHEREVVVFADQRRHSEPLSLDERHRRPSLGVAVRGRPAREDRHRGAARSAT